MLDVPPPEPALPPVAAEPPELWVPPFPLEVLPEPPEPAVLPPTPAAVSAFLPPFPDAGDVAGVGEHAPSIRTKVAKVRGANRFIVSFRKWSRRVTLVVAFDADYGSSGNSIGEQSGNLLIPQARKDSRKAIA